MTRRLSTAVLLLALIAAAGCGGGEERLTIYSGRDQALVGPILERFAEETGTGIDVRYGDSAELALLCSPRRATTPRPTSSTPSRPAPPATSPARTSSPPSRTS